MTIQTDVPGSPTDIRSAAETLDPTVKDAAEGAGFECHRMSVGTSGHWFGTSGQAYRETMVPLGDACGEASDLAADAAEKLRSYAGQLERMDSDFAQHRDDARAAGLPVVGTVIHPPVDTLGYCPAENAPQADLDAWDAYQDKVAVYNEIAEDVGAQWGDLLTWISQHLEAFLGEIPAAPMAQQVLDGLGEANEIIITTYLDLTEHSWKGLVNDLTTEAAARTQDVTDFMQELLDGNNVTRDTVQETLRRLNAISETDDLLRGVRRGLKGLPVVGWVLEGLGIWSDLESGRSPSSVGVEVIASAVGGAAVVAGTGALIAAGVITAPAWVPVAAGVAGAVAIGAGAVWAYEELVPQDIRESIDAGITDAWDATTDFAEDAWDAAGDAWNWAFG